MLQKLFYLGNIYDDIIKVIKFEKENHYSYFAVFNNNLDNSGQSNISLEIIDHN